MFLNVCLVVYSKFSVVAVSYIPGVKIRRYEFYESIINNCNIYIVQQETFVWVLRKIPFSPIVCT